jgi:hypothetical protein
MGINVGRERGFIVEDAADVAIRDSDIGHAPRRAKTLARNSYGAGEDAGRGDSVKLLHVHVRLE